MAIFHTHNTRMHTDVRAMVLNTNYNITSLDKLSLVHLLIAMPIRDNSDIIDLMYGFY